MDAQQEHRESLEEQATQATDEARMVLPGVQAIMGFQLIAAFNQRFETLAAGDRSLHLVAFFLVMLAMGLPMAPAAYHRQRERGRVTRRFVDLASALMTWALLPLMIGLAADTYILVFVVADDRMAALAGALVVLAASCSSTDRGA